MEQQRPQVTPEDSGYFDKFRQDLADAAGTISRLEGERLKLLSAIGEGALIERELTKENKALRDKARAETEGHKAILAVLDNVERMMGHLKTEYDGTWIHSGAERVYKSFRDALGKMGIEVVDCEPGAQFDPEIHEAVALEPGKKGVIVTVVQRGYKYADGGVIQYVRVTVGDA